jgi:amino acid adenylation domain-containing protein
MVESQQHLAEAKAYWQGALSGFTATTSLGVEQKGTRQPGESADYGRQQTTLTKELAEALREFGQHHDVRLETLIHGAWAILLSRYSGETEVLFGSISTEPLNGSAKVKPISKPVVRPLPSRVKVDAEARVGAWLKRLQELRTVICQYGDVSLAQLQAWSGMSPGQSFFESSIASGDAADAFLRVEEDGSRHNLSLKETSCPLVVLARMRERLTLEMVYSRSLFAENVIQQLMRHLRTLLEGMVANSEMRLSALPLLTEPERKQLIEWNSTQVTYPAAAYVHQLFEKQAEARPNAVALVFEEETLTYGELNRRANQLAHHLRRLGVGPETLVGICVERSLEMVWGLLGILKAGGAYVPFDPAHPVERLSYMLEDSGVSLLLTQQRFAEAPPLRAVKVLLLDAGATVFRQECGENPSCSLSPDNAAYAIYTSGSTGHPKAAINTHRAITNRLLWMQDTYHLKEADRVLQKTPFSFDVSVWEFFWPLMVGARLVLARPGGHRDSAYLARLLVEQEITTLHFVPSMLRVFLEESGSAAGHNLRRVICSGEALDLALQERFFKSLGTVELHNLYGPTEAAVDVTSWRCESDSELGIVPIGRPISNIEIYLLDEQLQAVPVGVRGELYIGGVGLARCYLKRADLTAERFIPHRYSRTPGARLYRTGDLARYLADGNIEYLGRVDQQVKVRGMRIELGEIEAVLNEHPAIQEALVLAREYGPADKRLVAYLVPERNKPKPLARELQKYLREKLPDFMVPAAFVSLEALLLTPNGKVDRQALPAPDFSELKADYVAPRTPVEETLTAIWSEVLGAEQVGVHDDFFSMGGHSLLATMVITRVRQSLEIELPQRVFFETPTVAKLAQFVEEIKELRESSDGKSVLSDASRNLNELSAGERAALVMRLKKKPAEMTQEQTIPRRKDSGPVPLSFAQQRLWFLDQLGDSNYLVPTTSRLTGRLDVKALEDSLNEIVRRHEALRTTFTTIDSQPMQVIAPHLSLTMSVTDLSRLPLDERAVEARRLRKEALRPFDLERGPLVRASLLRLTENEHLLLLTMHHIVSDGWSLGVLIRELATLYEGFVAGQTPSLPELPIQYADFAVWQRQWLSGEVLERQLAYWEEQLGGSPAVLELPTDRPRPAVQTNQGSFLTCEIGKELTEALKELSRREGVSLYMLLLAAFKTLLARYAGQEQVVVGTPIANRNWIDIENLIGFFVNTLVLRTDLSGNPPFHELLKRIREVTLGAFAHQDVPFERLVEELQPERDTSRTPLFQVMFSLQNAPMPPLELSHVTMSLLQDESTAAQFDLTLDVTERPHGMECLLEYNTDIFEHSTAQRILTHFSNLLESIAANPQQRLRELPLLTEAERRKILVQWNDTARDYPQESCIHQLFEEQVERTPQAAALVFGDEHITYAELNHRANQLAHYLRQIGVRPETRVGILLKRSVEMPVALLATLKAGGAYVAFDPSYPPERLRYMLEDSDVSVLLTQERLLAGLPKHRARLICLDAEWASIAEHNAQNVQSGATASNLAYLVYTSGSTGRPKGILIEHCSLVNASYAFINNHRMTEGDRLLQFASLSFDVAAEEFCAAWLSGGCAVMRPEQVVGTYAEFVTLLQREKVTVVNLPASFWLEWLTALADHGGEMPESLRLVIVGNEKTLEGMLAKWRRVIGESVEWSNAYGPSETTITASNYEPSSTGWGRQEKSTVPIGRPVMNVEMYVLDAAQQLVPVGVAGELYIGGAGVARGYHKQAAQTAERFIPNPYSRKGGERLYRTGDAARYRADGNVEFLGRVDEQVKIRGFRVEVGEVEAVLAQHASVRESVVLAREDERGGHRLVAYVVSNNGEVSTEELRSYLKQQLLEYMVPSSFVMMEALPLTPNGKVDRRALPDADGVRTDADEAYVAPRSAMERTIANIWQEVLKVEKVGVNDNFFGLGGHSLLLVRAHSKVSEVLRVKLSMIEMFKYPTVSALAEHLSGQRGSMSAPSQTRNQAETRIEALNRQRQLRQRANKKQQVEKDDG